MAEEQAHVPVTPTPTTTPTLAEKSAARWLVRCKLEIPASAERELVLEFHAYGEDLVAEDRSRRASKKECWPWRLETQLPVTDISEVLRQAYADAYSKEKA